MLKSIGSLILVCYSACESNNRNATLPSLAQINIFDIPRSKARPPDFRQSASFTCVQRDFNRSPKDNFQNGSTNTSSLDFLPHRWRRRPCTLNLNTLRNQFLLIAERIVSDPLARQRVHSFMLYYFYFFCFDASTKCCKGIFCRI